jgi:hypothetical protein
VTVNTTSLFPALWRYAHRGSGEGFASASPALRSPMASLEPREREK